MGGGFIVQLFDICAHTGTRLLLAQRFYERDSELGLGDNAGWRWCKDQGVLHVACAYAGFQDSYWGARPREPNTP